MIIIKKPVNKSAMIIAATALICVLLFYAVSVLHCQAKVITYINGDADGDNVISILDATKTQRLLAKLCEDPDGLIKVRADVNKNGLDITDATAIQRYLAKIENPFNIGNEMNWIMKGENELPEIDA